MINGFKGSTVIAPTAVEAESQKNMTIWIHPDIYYDISCIYYIIFLIHGNQMVWSAGRGAKAAENDYQYFNNLDFWTVYA